MIGLSGVQDPGRREARLEALRSFGCAFPGVSNDMHEHGQCIEVLLDDVDRTDRALRDARFSASLAVGQALRGGASQEQVEQARGRS